MTTPSTVAGKVSLIVYGFLGCSGAILFFNLFLERIISFLVFLLRHLRRSPNRSRRRRSQGRWVWGVGRASVWTNPQSARGERKREDGGRCSLVGNSDPTQKIDTEEEEEEDEDEVETGAEQNPEWKPSVYRVQLILFVTACLIASIASALYSRMENWAYFDSVYFCFVAFSTIGFGDLVSSQHQPLSPPDHAYRLANFLLLVFGCCCVYSFFNVTSLIIRSGLDWLIRQLNLDCSLLCSCRCCRPKVATRVHIPMVTRRRYAVVEQDVIDQVKVEGGRQQQRRQRGSTTRESSQCSEPSSVDCSDDMHSDEMISVQDFLRANKFSLAMFQKQLYETAQRGRGVAMETSGFQGGVGPLMIVDKKLGEGDMV